MNHSANGKPDQTKVVATKQGKRRNQILSLESKVSKYITIVLSYGEDEKPPSLKDLDEAIAADKLGVRCEVLSSIDELAAKQELAEELSRTKAELAEAESRLGEITDMVVDTDSLDERETLMVYRIAAKRIPTK